MILVNIQHNYSLSFLRDKILTNFMANSVFMKIQLHTFHATSIVTGPGKTGLIYTKHMCLYHRTYLLFCVCYPQSVSFTEFLMDLCIYDDILDAIRITDIKLLHFKLSKSGQILHIDKTCFPWPGHNYILLIV